MGHALIDIRYNIDKANRTDGRVQNLASHITVELLRDIHRSMSRHKASGIDQMTKDEYEANLEDNLEQLIARMKGGKYRPKPSRRVYIPKDGKGKMRPLGISSYEDKLVETAVAEILNQIYEVKFLHCSFGFRPGRNCHMAVKEIIEMSQYRKTNFVVEADIRSFFDTIDHEWLIRMLEHDIADRKFIGLIRRFLKAGIMDQGKYLETETGTPQGNGASPVLANVYLHYVLDLWFEKVVKRYCRRQCYLIRYADDFVCLFQTKYDADRFRKALDGRFAKFGLSLAVEKTKILEFGRFAKENRKRRGEGKPETFDFLGFTFYCGMDGKKRFYRCRVKTSKKKFRSKIKSMKEFIRANRHKPVGWLIMKVNEKLRGHYQYYGVTDNTREIKNFQNQTKWLLYKWLNRRSQRSSYTTDSFFNGLLRTFPIVEPSIRVSLFYR